MGKLGKAGALREEMNPQLAMVALVASLGAFTLGIDVGWWSGAIGNAYFGEVFGTATTVAADGTVINALSTAQTSTGSALGTAGIAIGCALAGAVADRWGRKSSFYISAIVSIFGAIIEITCGVNGYRYWQLVGGKLVVNIAIGISAVTVPLYLAEVSPASIRGALVNTYVWIQSLGGFCSIAVIYNLSTVTTSKVWILPVAVQFLPVAILLSLCWAIPESPRWLIEKGRNDVARSALLQLHSGKQDYDVDADLADLEAAFHSKSKDSGSWMACFKGSNLKRTYIATGIQGVQQGQGLSFVGNYLILFLIQLGYTNAYEILLILFGMLLIFTGTGFFVQDFVGRKILLIGGALVMGVCFLGIAIITTIQTAPTGALSTVCIFFIALWYLAFTQSWTNIPWTISAEIPADNLRDKTLALSAFVAYVTNLIVAEVSPYIQDAGYGNLAGKIGYIWFAMSMIAAVWTYFFVPELKGRSLEEVDWMFDNGVPIRSMGTYVIPKGVLPTANELAMTPSMDLAKEKARELEHEEEKA